MALPGNPFIPGPRPSLFWITRSSHKSEEQMQYEENHIREAILAERKRCITLLSHRVYCGDGMNATAVAERRGAERQLAFSRQLIEKQD